MPPKLIPKKHSKSKDSKSGIEDVQEISVDPVMVMSQDLEDYDSLSNMSSQWVYGSPKIPNSLEPTNDRVMIVSDRDKFQAEQNQKELILIPKLDFKKIDKYRQYAKDFAGVKEKTKTKGAADLEKDPSKVQGNPQTENQPVVPKPNQASMQVSAPKQADKPSKQQKQPLVEASAPQQPGGHKPPLPNAVDQANPQHQLPQITQTQQVEGPQSPILQRIGFFCGFGLFFLVGLIDLLAWNQSLSTLNLSLGKMVVSLVASNSFVMVVVYIVEQLLFMLLIVPGYTIYKAYLGCLNPSSLGTFCLVFLGDALLKNGFFFGVQMVFPKEKWRATLTKCPRFACLAEMLDKELLYGILIHLVYFPEYALLAICAILTTQNSKWTHVAALNGANLLQALLVCLLSLDSQRNVASFVGITSNFEKSTLGVLFMIIGYLRFVFTVGYFILVLLKVPQNVSASAVIPVQKSQATASPANNQSTKTGGLLAKKSRLQGRSPQPAGVGSKDPKNHDDSELNMVNK
jgi:hypothetical protein